MAGNFSYLDSEKGKALLVYLQEEFQKLEEQREIEPLKKAILHFTKEYLTDKEFWESISKNSRKPPKGWSLKKLQKFKDDFKILFFLMALYTKEKDLKIILKMKRFLKNHMTEKERKLFARFLDQIAKMAHKSRDKAIAKMAHKSRDKALEISAIGSLRGLFSAQMQFYLLKKKIQNGRAVYGNFQDLKNNNMFTSFDWISKDGLEAKRGEYAYKLVLSKDGSSFEIYATPIKNKNLRRFFLDNSGNITYTTDGSTPNEKSKPVD
ncbi:MAG: hypothetical protein D6785_14070 [Planctomycetota bacterium]|nr:MAG: hypothetical protein D6785_14070 [Planctomycetota bacterium]